ncbi:co-chaperone GrpE [Ancylostoma caninum]|uniref:Co-chaperone GrpE n=1 Tax=Ancylostoma caninum TaxID=29170 RepID=A0A368F6V4_ANCCA|nr:co-chaperone GrpE [Ancylostoma caninum]
MCRTLSYVFPSGSFPARILRLQTTSRTGISFCSTSANNAEKDGEAPKFQLKKPDGKRLTGAEFFDMVKEAASKEGKEDFAVPTPAFEALLAEYDLLVKEGLDWKDKYQRSLAETENVRKRGFKQTEEAKVADVLDLAVDSVKPEQLKTADKTLVDLHEGIAMTRTVLFKTFKKHGLVPVSPLGEKFDPNLHEAVFQVPAGPDAKAEPGHIMHVSKIGYCLKERPIRAAQVGVVVDS